MSAEHLLGAIVSLLLTGYLVYALLRPERYPMTLQGWLQIALFCFRRRR